MNRLCVIGLGYIGLPTAVLAASSGLDVLGVDIDEDVVRNLSSGRAHIHEPSLDAMLYDVLARGTLTVQREPSPADVFLIAVPTPIREDKTADLDAVVSASESIIPHIRPGSLVIVESTVPPGTSEGTVQPILERSGLKAGTDFFLAYCPERVLPGRIVEELVANDRVIGGLNHASAERALEFYRYFVKGEAFLTDLRTAEMVKLVENSFRDVNIAFANEVSLIAGRLGVDVWKVIELANRHPRVNILSPGPGVGGHCIAVDPWFIVEKVPDLAELIATARRVNDSMPEHIVARVEAAVPPGARVSCLGASYKANVGDTRESPALEVFHRLEQKGYRVCVADPYVSDLNGFRLVSLEKAIEDAECLVLLVDHAEFIRLDVGMLWERFGGGKLIDTRGAWRVRDRHHADA